MLRRLVLVALVWIVVLVVVRAVAAPAEGCPTVTAASLRSGVDAAVGWFARNQQPDGTFLFRYDAASGRDLGGYEAIHHAGAIQALEQVASQGIAAARPVADAAEGWALGQLATTADGQGQVFTSGTGAEAGASALLVAGLATRRATTADTGHDATLHALGHFLAGQVQPDGAVASDWSPTAGPVVGTRDSFGTSEVWWAFTLLHREFPGEGWDRLALRIGNYVATERDGVESQYPEVSDHWAAYAMATMAAWPGVTPGTPLPEPLARYAERLSGVMGVQVRWESTRTGEGLNVDLRGGRAIPAGLGTLGEGSAALWRLSALDDRLAPVRPLLAERAACAAGMLSARQVSPRAAAGYPEPSRVEGGWLHGGATRVDDEQHAMTALLRALPVAGAPPVGRPGATSDVSVVVAGLALIAVVNPARLALAAPARPDRRQRLGIVAIGAAGALAVAVVLAWLSGPILDGLGVSNASARMAVGIVLAVTAGLDLIGRLPKPEPALAGWGAAVVPVFVPLALRPGLALAAISLGADHGTVAVGVGVAIAGALAVGATALVGPGRDTADPGGGPAVRLRVLRWFVAVTAAVLAALAVALVVDGIYSV